MQDSASMSRAPEDITTSHSVVPAVAASRSPLYIGGGHLISHRPPLQKPELGTFALVIAATDTPS